MVLVEHKSSKLGPMLRRVSGFDKSICENVLGFQTSCFVCCYTYRHRRNLLLALPLAHHTVPCNPSSILAQESMCSYGSSSRSCTPSRSICGTTSTRTLSRARTLLPSRNSGIRSRARSTAYTISDGTSTTTASTCATCEFQPVYWDYDSMDVTDKMLNELVPLLKGSYAMQWTRVDGETLTIDAQARVAPSRGSQGYCCRCSHPKKHRGVGHAGCGNSGYRQAARDVARRWQMRRAQMRHAQSAFRSWLWSQRWCVVRDPIRDRSGWLSSLP